MKNNIDFYQHYANSDQHPKFKMLRTIYGWAGEGQFWALNNRIAQAENCCLDISKKYNKAAIAADLGFSLETFDGYIKCLMDDCELIKECSDGIITTDIIQENFQRVSGDRNAARERFRKKYTKEKGDSIEKGETSGEEPETSDEETYKVKESKVKESKGNKYSPEFETFWTAYPRKKAKGQAWKTWLKLKKQKSLPALETILKAIGLQKTGKDWLKDAGEFIPHPSTWLNGTGWDDEVETSGIPQRPQPKEITQEDMENGW